MKIQFDGNQPYQSDALDGRFSVEIQHGQGLRLPTIAQMVNLVSSLLTNCCVT